MFPSYRCAFDNAYTTVGSACIGIPIFIRLRYTAATSGRSSGFPGSFSMSDASVTACPRGPPLRLSSFFLDERRERDRLPRRQPFRGSPRTHRVIVDSKKPIEHQVNDARGRNLPRQRVCFRKQIPFEV